MNMGNELCVSKHHMTFDNGRKKENVSYVFIRFKFRLVHLRHFLKSNLLLPFNSFF